MCKPGLYLPRSLTPTPAPEPGAKCGHHWREKSDEQQAGRRPKRRPCSHGECRGRSQSRPRCLADSHLGWSPLPDEIATRERPGGKLDGVSGRSEKRGARQCRGVLCVGKHARGDRPRQGGQRHPNSEDRERAERHPLPRGTRGPIRFSVGGWLEQRQTTFGHGSAYRARDKKGALAIRMPLHDCASTQKQRDDREHEEDDEQQLRDARGAGRDATKTEDRCDDGDDEKNGGPMEHDVTSYPTFSKRRANG
jgi:hypothetical protein